MKLKIYDYIPKYSLRNRILEIPPKEFDYDLLDLVKKITMVYGDITEVVYYAEFNPSNNTYSIPLVKEQYQYYYVNNLPYRRLLTISWYYIDGTLCTETKTKQKYYNAIDSMIALKSKRSNIIADIKISLVGWLLMSGSVSNMNDSVSTAKGFLEQVINDIKLFEDGNSIPLIAILTNTNNSWLDNTIPQLGKTIRLAILEQINYPT
jgi:hypothetical protein